MYCLNMHKTNKQTFVVRTCNGKKLFLVFVIIVIESEIWLLRKKTLKDCCIIYE